MVSPCSIARVCCIVQSLLLLLPRRHASHGMLAHRSAQHTSPLGKPIGPTVARHCGVQSCANLSPQERCGPVTTCQQDYAKLYQIELCITVLANTYT